jgi:hypothetical protein
MNNDHKFFVILSKRRKMLNGAFSINLLVCLDLNFFHSPFVKLNLIKSDEKNLTQIIS